MSSDQWCRNISHCQTLAPRWHNLSLAQTQAVIKPMYAFSGLKGSNTNSFHIELHIVRAVLRGGGRRFSRLLPATFKGRKKKSRTKRNPYLFDTPPTCWIYLATWNLNDSLVYCTYLVFISEGLLAIYSCQVNTQLQTQHPELLLS